MSKEELKKLHAQGRISEVIDVLLDKSKDGRFHNDVVQQSVRWKEYQQLTRNANSTDTSQQLLRNRISATILELIDEVYGSSTKKRLAWWEYVVRVGVVVGIIAGIVATLKHLEYIGSGSSVENGSITVLVHGPEGKDDLVLPNRGEVTLLHGDEVTTKQINNRGEITFKQINETYSTGASPVEFSFTDPQGEPYRLRYPDSSYHIQSGKSILLEVILEGMDQLEGIVKDFVTGEPLDSVLIRIPGHSYYTNEFGEFTIDIPEERQEQFIDLSLTKPGYERKELSKVPTTTKQQQKISLKPL